MDYFETSLSQLHIYHKTNSELLQVQDNFKLLQHYTKATSKGLQTVLQNFLNMTSRHLQGYNKTDSRALQTAVKTIFQRHLANCIKSNLRQL